MADRTLTLDRRLFADKGDARPAPDFVPRLKTAEPARLPPSQAAPREAMPGAGGALGGLIKRHAPVAPTPAALEAQRAAERLAHTVSEQADNGMLYESLKMGLPLPDLAVAKSNGEAGSLEEVAPARISRPFGLSAARPRARRKLTVRLALDDFRRLKTHAEESGRTYQDILASATLSHLAQIAPKVRPAHAHAPGPLARAFGLFRRR